MVLSKSKGRVKQTGKAARNKGDVTERQESVDAGEKKATNKLPKGKEESLEVQEKRAASKLRLAEKLLQRDRKSSVAAKWLREILEKYPDTKAAKEARKILDEQKRG
jgi:hypothetical protein